MKFKFLPLVLVTIYLISSFSLLAQKERDYIKEINSYLNGQTEVSVVNGRIDILTNNYAIEVEFADKWKNSIGQALWYGLQKNCKSGIVLVLRENSEWKYVNMLNSALTYAEIDDKIKVWIWPNDFVKEKSHVIPSSYDVSDKTPSISKKVNYGNSIVHPKQSSVSFEQSYWLTVSSGVRHNKTCGYFNDTKGRYCNKNEGRACKKCGG